MDAREWGREIGFRSVWFIVREGSRYALYNPLETLGAIYILDRWGWAGARFLGRSGAAVLRSQVRLGFEIGRLAVIELAPAGVPQNLMRPFARGGAAIGRALPPIARGATVVARGAGWAVRASPYVAVLAAGYLLAQGPEMQFELLSDPNSAAYVLDDETGEIVATPYLEGPMGTGFL